MTNICHLLIVPFSLYLAGDCEFYSKLHHSDISLLVTQFSSLVPYPTLQSTQHWACIVTVGPSAQLHIAVYCLLHKSLLCLLVLQLVPYYILNVINFPGLPGIFLSVLFSGAMRYVDGASSASHLHVVQWCLHLSSCSSVFSLSSPHMWSRNKINSR